ncbi:hypothetical protein LSH36_455g03000 [Paralvinella palmiformis]|uniref:ADF-H domain-containing protein n=1 Tax=Paralvinella palmiformis TaxID=53620 RepID=A0AAD9JA43_9ANNE|nr:hypothetical protein LSH36_455g03000 [Paralvinella palmiformis]
MDNRAPPSATTQLSSGMEAPIDHVDPIASTESFPKLSTLTTFGGDTLQSEAYDPQISSRIIREEQMGSIVKYNNKVKVDMSSQMLIVDEEFEDVTLEDIQNELPASQPRFLVYSYCHEHDDGRKSYPLCFIFITPAGCKPEQQMAYAGSKLSLVKEAELTKVFEVRNPEDLTDDWLKEKVKFFR